MKLLITSAWIFITFFSACAQENEYQLSDVVVTAGRVPSSDYDIGRSFLVITQQDILNSPVDNIQDLLQYSAGIDIRQRGNEGVQGDISIRGGTSEQTLVMINGFKISDPQTGHHNLNLPVNLKDIERIEILKGQGSKSFGANAFSGVINIITKTDTSGAVRVNTSGGQHSLFSYGASVSLPASDVISRLSVNRKKSDGYRHNTAFDDVTLYYESSLNTRGVDISLLAGYDDKKFGANGFYPIAPDQWEHTTAYLAGVSGKIQSGSLLFIPKIYWRRHKDRYLLSYVIPSLYENNHRTDIYGYEIQASLETPLGVTSAGAELIKDKIVSSNLGNHSRETIGFFAEQKLKIIKNVSIVLGGFAYNYPSLGWRLWPGADIAYHPLVNLKLYASAGKAFRIPTYTDLYYSGGGSQGNPALKHEETLNFETGINFFQNRFLADLSFFRKQGKNIIDWFYNNADRLWVANNVAEINTNGFEVSLNYAPGKNNVFTGTGLSYTYLNLQKKLSNTVSRYLLDHLRQQLVITVGNKLPFDVMQSWGIRFEDRINLEKHWLFDTRLTYNINNWNLFLNISNLLNTSYRDMVNVPLPGRWISAGIEMKLNFE